MIDIIGQRWIADFMTEVDYQLVHANTAIPCAPLDDPRMKGFTGRIDEIDAFAQGWDGLTA